MTNMAESFNTRQVGALPGLLGFEWLEIVHGAAKGRFTVAAHHMSPNGFLHAGTVVTFADTACGYGCVASLPDGANSFTTIEMKSNHLGTAREGVVTVEARLVHGGRNTQVWDAEVKAEATGKIIALFRCTQMVLYPKA